MKWLLQLIFMILSTSSYADVLPDFQLTEYKTNKIVKLSSLVKERKVVLNFWASWCKSCIHELKELETLKKNFPNTIFIAINAGENNKKVKKFLKKYKFSYRILMDTNKGYSKSIGVLSLPQTFVIGKNLEILYKADVPPKKI